VAEDRTGYLTWIDFQLLITLSAAIFGLPSSHAGSKALSGSLGQVFYDSLSDIAQGFLDVVNGLPGVPMTGLLWQLVDRNVEMHEGFRPPQLEVVGLEHQDLKALADVVTKLEQFFGLTFDAEDELHFRKLIKMPTPSVEELERRRAEWIDRPRRLSEGGTQAPQTGTQQTPASEPAAEEVAA